MAVVEELLRSEKDGTISFGNHALANKAKLEDFEHCGDLYKVKTFKTMTRLEKNGMFVYESVPGTSVSHFAETPEDTEYEVFVNEESIGKMKTNLSGKLILSAELAEAAEVKVRIAK